MNIKKLKALLKEKNISIYRLSKITGISTGRLTDLVNGKNPNLTLNTLLKIAKALELSEHEFCELCGYKTPNQETQKLSKGNIE